VTERELLDLIARARDEEWEELDLAGLDLDVLPLEIGSLVKLQNLNLCENEIIVIPESIGQLVNLQRIDFSE
jgi:Leucine-rich repeat (LRR) protein